MKRKRILTAFIVSMTILLSLLIFSINTNKNRNKEEVTKDIVVETKVKEEKVSEEKIDTKPVYSDKLAKIIEDYLSKKNFDKDLIAISIHSYKTNEFYNLNENKYLTAASTYKLYLAVIYYDLINEGKYSLSDRIKFEEHMYEPGGFVGDNYSIGDSIDLKSLLHYSISDSDNSASHILFENLGGWIKLKNLAKTYTNTDTSDSIYNSYENVVTTSFLMDFLDRIYQNQDKYELLIDDMKNSTPREYLNGHESMHGKLAQKYGNIEGVDNAAGIYLDKDHPYSIAILTSFGGYGEKVISDISEIVYNYFTETNKK